MTIAGKSGVQCKKSSDPCTERWGTPKGSWASGERTSSSLICCLLPVKYEDTQFSAWPDVPNQFCDLPEIIVRSMVSKAGDKSNKMRAVTLPLSIAVKISLWMRRSAVSVECFFP